MGDPRRELYLSNEIDRLQDEKLEALKRTKESTGFEKAQSMEDFLQLNNRQADLEDELAVLKEDHLLDEDDEDDY
jgi:hypothetical protein